MNVLDTNVVSEAMKNEPHPGVREWLNEKSADTLYPSSVTLAELLLGVGALPAGKRQDGAAIAEAIGSGSSEGPAIFVPDPIQIQSGKGGYTSDDGSGFWNDLFKGVF